MKQRLAILISLLKQPELLILDEGFTFIDVEHKTKLVNYLRSKTINKEMTLLFTTHSQSEGAFLANEIKSFDGLSETD